MPISRKLKGQQGASLVEAVVALAILGLAMSSLMAGLSTSYISENKGSVLSAAESLARNQMEYIFAQPYQPPPGAYSLIATPAGYSVAVEALEYELGNPNIEIIQSTIYHGGQEVLAIEALRSNR